MPPRERIRKAVDPRGRDATCSPSGCNVKSSHRRSRKTIDLPVISGPPLLRSAIAPSLVYVATPGLGSVSILLRIIQVRLCLLAARRHWLSTPSCSVESGSSGGDRSLPPQESARIVGISHSRPRHRTASTSTKHLSELKAVFSILLPSFRQ